jgi:hypothetical protein
MTGNMYSINFPLCLEVINVELKIHGKMKRGGC